MCDFVGRRMGGIEVLEGGLLDPPPPPTPLSKEAKKAMPEQGYFMIDS